MLTDTNPMKEYLEKRHKKSINTITPIWGNIDNGTIVLYSILGTPKYPKTIWMTAYFNKHGICKWVNEMLIEDEDFKVYR
jgi:hypothetical protein